MATTAKLHRNDNAPGGYKGHRAGTLAEKAHRLLDDKLAKKAERQEVLARFVKMGLTPATAANWYGSFQKKPAAKKPAAKKNGKAK
jgi:hypothetical protein